MMRIGTNQSTNYHSQSSLTGSGGQTGHSSSTSRQQQPSQLDNEQLANIRPRLCILRKWPHYDGYGVHLARNQHWLGLRIGDVEPNSPAESGGLLREDVVLAVNGHSVENDDFFVILSFIQHELEDDQIRFLVLDPHNADLARRYNLNIDENYRTIVRMETPVVTVSPEKLLYDQWRTINNMDPTIAQNTINLGPTSSSKQSSSNLNAQRYRDASPNQRRDDVYTFLPYSDHAIENGKSVFDILFDQNKPSSTTQQNQQHTLNYQPKKPFTDHDEKDHDDNDNKDNKLSNFTTDVKNKVKTGLGAIKSVLPTKHQDDTEKFYDAENQRKSISEPIDTTKKPVTSPSILDRIKGISKIGTSSPIASKTTEEDKQPESYDKLWQTSPRREDTNNNSRSEPRMCSITLRPGIDTIGISIQQDKDFGHIIKDVEPNSLAARAGIEKDDCIMSLNDTTLLNIPYNDVLNTLKQSRNEKNLDFRVAKKSYLLKFHPTKTSSVSVPRDEPGRYNDSLQNTTGEVMPSSNIPASETLAELYKKYSAESKSSFDEPTTYQPPKETISKSIPDERFSRLSPQSEDDDRYTNQQRQQGQILQGVGPATVDRSTWGTSTGRKVDDSALTINDDTSIRSDLRGRGPDSDNKKGIGAIVDSLKPLQVGITNPTPTQQLGSSSPILSSGGRSDDGQRTSRPGSSIEPRDSSPKGFQTSDARTTTSTTRDRSPSPSTKTHETLQNIPNLMPTGPSQTPTTKLDYNQGITQKPLSPQTELRLGSTIAKSLPISSIQTNQPMTIDNDDTDDSDLSHISERSREEDISEYTDNKNVSPISSGFADNKNKDDLHSSLVKSPPHDVVLTSSKPDSTYKDKDSFTSASSDVDKNTLINTKAISQARRLEASDSEDTTSGTDSHVVKQQGGDAFYSPNESIDDEHDSDDQDTNTWEQRGNNEVNQFKPADNKQDQDKTDNKNDDHDDDDSSTDSEPTEGQKTPVESGKMALATMPLSSLKDHGYELHNIKLMQPTETSPVGLKLTRQQDPLQYVITAVAKGTKADLAGLKINDWLVKIEDNDIRLLEFAEVSQDIRQLLTNAGVINMVIARKRTPLSSPTTREVGKQETSSSSRTVSATRQQGGSTPSSLLTTDITRDTPDKDQVRFVPDESKSPTLTRSKHSPTSTRESNLNAPAGTFSVGLTNRIPGESLTKSPRSQSRSPSHSPTREYKINQSKVPTEGKTSEDVSQNRIRDIVLQEALGLDFNSFIPEGDRQVQTHFISNVQPSSIADKAGLRDGDRILSVNGVDVTNSLHEDVRRMMQSKKPLTLSVVNDPGYIELIESLKDSTNRGRQSLKKIDSDSGSDSNIALSKSDSQKAPQEDLSKYLRPLFTDDKGTLQVKHCVLKKDSSYNGYGLLLRYQNGLHLIDQVEQESPAYNAGLREDDVILSIDRKNVEQMTHDDVKILIRKLSLSNTDIDLILMKRNDIPRYKSYQEKNTINWKPILTARSSSDSSETERLESNFTRSTNEAANVPRTTSTSSTSSGKQAAPPPPTSSTTQSSSSSNTRICILQPSADRTAGFALSGKSPPPFIICQIEPNSPAEQAGLVINDTLLSVNGKSVSATSYEETVKIIKEALQQKRVELLVQNSTSSGLKDNKQEQAKFSMGSADSSHTERNDSLDGEEPSHRGANAVEEYQKQRNKELSYSLRLCHLHPTNVDGTQSQTFGFELSEEPDYEYPLILNVEPNSPAEGAGLQSRDILLKVNERKTKGLGYDKVKKEIEKAKRDGRLEMLVVDQETYDYCKRTKKPLKEPEMKVKHIFPKSRSSASFHRLPDARKSSVSSRDSAEQLTSSMTKDEEDVIPLHHRTEDGYHISREKDSDSENDGDNKKKLSEQKGSNITSSQDNKSRNSQPVVNFHLFTPSDAHSDASPPSQQAPLKLSDSAHTKSQKGAAPSIENSKPSVTSQSATSLTQTSTKETKDTKDTKTSKAKAIPNAINSLFHKIGHSKSSKRS